ncbi:hypothetical protein A3A64_02725 [Candidatus Gottesmanbacteria bacterium RIFCSPLOWO2_01_FULL_48_11]|uniref:C5-O-methyltransferase n=2 Tax=Candidatus Gottesmaniibacteriota TaxID=1752720 RepID=A0A0G1U055_9BACT|nr:MAG: C5-O-methyltransferase [Candidatus Gottesmanbacteria bacterium GW2011_GWA2_47_9]OGG27945.1 MAG: hypothetical protein A3A64_02725 [Candidatus Gottesmanbacteria bacterium RIFCSPLOWO2_01_FULL_48_11]
MGRTAEAAAVLGHTQAGTEYGDGVKAYAVARHGPDGARFLDPYFQRHLQNLEGKSVIDVGTGHAPWGIFAAQHGAKEVHGVDIQMGMANGAVQAVKKEGLANKVKIYRADGASLPYPSGQFDVALSINVGCNLPLTSSVGADGTSRQVGFLPHFTEIARVLKDGGRAIVTAPASFGEVFTTGTRGKRNVLRDIKAALEKIGDSTDPEVIKSNLNTLTDVHRATFARRKRKLVLIKDESQLISGENIWRKLPGLTVPNRYHSEDEYKKAFKKAGLRVRTVQRRTFKTSGKRGAHNRGLPNEKRLGREYDNHHPFVVWVVEKSIPEGKGKKRNAIIVDKV